MNLNEVVLFFMLYRYEILLVIFIPFLVFLIFWAFPRIEKKFNEKDKLIDEKDETLSGARGHYKELLIEDMIEEGLNEFRFTLPYSKNDLTFKILTQGDEKKIDKELEGLKKLFPKATPPELTTKLKYIITSINGDRESKTIREFVDQAFLAKDSIALRDEIKRVQPDIILEYVEEGEVEGTPIPINLNFFWPKSAI